MPGYHDNMSFRFSLPYLLSITLGATALASPDLARADESTPFHMTDAKIWRPETGFEVQFGQYGDNAIVGLQGFIQWPIGERWSLTGRLPLAYAYNDGIDGVGLGNLTVDATLFLSAEKRRRATNVTAFQLSVSGPTASRGVDSGFATGTMAGYFLPDPGLYQPNTTTIRLYGTWRTGSRSFFGQLEGGMQQLVIRNADDRTLLRIAGGAGVRVGSNVVLIGEFVGVTDIIDDADGDNFWSSLDLGMRAKVGKGNISLRVYLPLDGQWRNLDTLGVALGYEASL